jgi:hypothetical protein
MHLQRQHRQQQIHARSLSRTRIHSLTLDIDTDIDIDIEITKFQYIGLHELCSSSEAVLRAAADKKIADSKKKWRRLSSEAVLRAAAGKKMAQTQDAPAIATQANRNLGKIWES